MYKECTQNTIIQTFRLTVQIFFKSVSKGDSSETANNQGPIETMSTVWAESQGIVLQ